MVGKMRIEVLCTGDELLTGLTTDTNSPWFEAKLFELGEQVRRLEIVGDVREDIVGALRAVAERADAVLVSGGLGPTADDLTAECAAAAAGVPLVENAEALAWLNDRFAKRNVTLTENNLRQALVPTGAEVIRNEAGSAPMFIQRVGRCTLFFVPGVPREYKWLVDHVVLPRLEGLISAGEERVFRAAKLLRTVGLPESHLDAKVAPLAQKHAKVRFGFRTQAPENHLKLLAEAESQASADAALAAAERDCRGALGNHVFGEGDTSFAAAVGDLLRARSLSVAVAESVTGGLTSELLSGVPGATAFFRGGVVSYVDDLKEAWLGVPAELLAAHGAVSAEVARAMAVGVREKSRADFGVAVTGFAGPTGGTDRDPVGAVYAAISGAGVDLVDRQIHLGDRSRIRTFAAYQSLELLRRALLESAR